MKCNSMVAEGVVGAYKVFLFAVCLVSCGDSSSLEEALTEGGLPGVESGSGDSEQGEGSEVSSSGSTVEAVSGAEVPDESSPDGEVETEEQVDVEDVSNEPLDEDSSTPEDEAGGLGQPLAVSPPGVEEHGLFPAGDIDCFSFETQEERTIEVTTSDGNGACSSNSALYLYEGGQTNAAAPIAFSDPSVAEVCAELQSTRPAGSYVVCVEHVDRLAPLPVLGLFTRIELSEPVSGDAEGSLEQPTAVTLPLRIEHDINPESDSDCFAFTTDSEQFIRSETTDGQGGCPGDARAFLYAGDETDRGNPLASDDDSGPGRCPLLNTLQQAGDYILCVEPYSPAIIEGLVTEIRTEGVGADLVGGREAPASVNLPSEIEHGLERGDDSDCFAFTTLESQLIVAETSDGAGGCPGDTEIFLFAEGGLSALASNDNALESSCSRLEVVQPPGDYVLCVEGGFFSSSSEPVLGITTSIAVAPTPIDEAGELENPKVVSLPASEAHDLNGQDDVDCFSFETAEERLIVGQATTSEQGCTDSLRATLYAGGERNLNNPLAVSDQGSFVGCPDLHSIQPAGNYTLCMRHSSVFSSRVVLDVTTTISLLDPPVDEAGDLTDPKPVNLPAVELHDINLAGDVDCFAFDLVEPRSILAETGDGTGDCPGDTVISLYRLGLDGDFIVEANNDDGGIGFCSRLETPQPAGSYQLCVEQFSSSRRIFGITTTIVGVASE